MLRVLFVLVVLVAGVAWFGYRDYQNFLTAPLPLNDANRTFVVEKGWSAKRVSAELVNRGLVSKPHWLEVYTRTSGNASAIKSGEFQLPESLTVPAFFDVLVAGQTVQYSHGIIEGLTYKEMLQRLARADDLVQTLEDSSGADIMAAIGKPDVHPEGQFFADTYRFPRNTSDIDYLRRANAMLDRVLQEEWENREPNLPLETPYEALILASIVEKETAQAAERPLIAQVFLSRLIKGMRLQTDPTVIYGIGDTFDGNIRRSDLRTDTPYNTYTRGGLPPTPISNVGRAAIHAVLHPEPTSALYFVSRGDGTHKFSDTIEQHNDAVAEYQLRRRKTKPAQ